MLPPQFLIYFSSLGSVSKSQSINAQGMYILDNPGGNHVDKTSQISLTHQNNEQVLFASPMSILNQNEEPEPLEIVRKSSLDPPNKHGSPLSKGKSSDEMRKPKTHIVPPTKKPLASAQSPQPITERNLQRLTHNLDSGKSLYIPHLMSGNSAIVPSSSRTNRRNENIQSHTNLLFREYQTNKAIHLKK